MASPAYNANAGAGISILTATNEHGEKAEQKRRRENVGYEDTERERERDRQTDRQTDRQRTG